MLILSSNIFYFIMTFCEERLAGQAQHFITFKKSVMLPQTFSTNSLMGLPT